MKTIKIMIAASEEMHDEKVQFSSLIENLNEVLEPRGIELKRVKWNPETDGTIEDYQAKLRDCEMCLTLYWRELAGNSEEELDTAYQELKDGNNPRKLYVFFKEPEENLTEALKDFKTNFVSNYGHFFCKFENVDTMNLHFILQFEAYQNHNQKDLVKVSDGKVLVCNKEMVSLEKIPFAALNKEYQRLQKELSELNAEIAKNNRVEKTNSKDKKKIKQYASLNSKRNKIRNEFEKYQKRLHDIALNFVMLSGQSYSDRIRKAREQFEMGNIIEADQILNIEEMKNEAKKDLELLEQHKKSLALKIEEFQLKTETVLANTSLSIPMRFGQACEAMEEAISIARKIKYDEEKYTSLLFNYATLLQNFNKFREATFYYQEALEIRRQMNASVPNSNRSNLADLLNGYGILQMSLHKYPEAKQSLLEALEIRRQLVSTSPNDNNYLSDLAISLSNLGALLVDIKHYVDAEQYFQEALEIRTQLVSVNPSEHLPDLADTFSSLGALQINLGRNADAEQSFQDALTSFKKLSHTKLYKLYLPNLVGILNNLGLLHNNLGRYSDADKNLREAVKILRLLAESNPDSFLPDLARMLNNLSTIQSHLDQQKEAEKSSLEALEILRTLTTSNSDAYQPDLAESLNNLGVLQNMLKCPTKAEELLLESLEIRRRYASVEPDAYLNKLADSLNNLAIVQKDLGHFANSERNFIEALSIYRKLAKASQDLYQPDLANALGNYGNLLRKTERYAEAKKSYSEALVNYLLFTKTHPGTYQKEIEKIFVFMEDVQQKIGPSMLSKVFCNSKKWCKNLWSSICRLFSIS